jgi:hypothetical protein
MIMQETGKQESELESLAREIFTRAAGYANGQCESDIIHPSSENAFSDAEWFMAKKYGRSQKKDLTPWRAGKPRSKENEISVTVDVLDENGVMHNNLEYRTDSEALMTEEKFLSVAWCYSEFTKEY